MRCLELEVLNATYTKDSVAALRKVKNLNQRREVPFHKKLKVDLTFKGAREALLAAGGERAGAFQPSLLSQAISGKTQIPNT